LNPVAVALLSLNVAGIPLIHAHWAERRAEIGDRLKREGYDIVALQEAWLDGDARELSRRSGLPHYARFERGLAMGDGLAILSRWPITETKRVVFSLGPSKLRSLNGEPIANKGALLARVATPHGPLDVYDAHLIASYPGAPYDTFRLAQAFELFEFIAANSSTTPFVLMGDLNAAPDDPPARLLRDLLSLSDLCDSTRCGPTDANGRRIDHILAPDRTQGSARVLNWPPLPLGGPLSDHKGVLGSIRKPAKASVEPRRRSAALKSVEAALARMTELMLARSRRWSWAPLFGSLMTLRYDHQLERVYSLRQRVETARIRAAR
jgi:endonuclease/exonuclease/phosphatase family metal-dependent hydrolase